MTRATLEDVRPRPAKAADQLACLADRLREQEARLQRPIRVLLIGNIANNAFYMAKLLRKCGLECDVLCYDYYHVMGCPEWEDADFDGRLADDYRPQWDTVDLRGYRRPRWFVQGPLLLCMDYLHARLSGSRTAEARLWSALMMHNGYAGLARGALGRVHWASRHLRRSSDLLHRLVRFALAPPRVREKFEEVYIAGRHSPTFAKRLIAAAANKLRLPASALSLLLARAYLALARTVAAEGQSTRSIEETVQQFNQRFPDRGSSLDPIDLIAFTLQAERWRRLLQYYDLVQGFSTETIFPMLSGRPYSAFEHGTLREIPDRPTPLGRLTALSYSRASHVFVTNSDCMPTARRLAGDRAEFVNHPYDDDDAGDVTGWRELRAALQARLDADFILCHPTRHDWVAGTRYADKSNDVFLRALAHMRKAGYMVGAVLCSWGLNVRESQELIRNLGLERHVFWEHPMPRRKFFRTALACGLVVDQFKLPSIGGVAFKALAAGVPVCTRLDAELAERTFGAAPPVINCTTTDDLMRELPPLLTSRERLAELSAASRDWFRRYHAGDAVLSAHLRAYLDELERRDAPDSAPPFEA